MDDANDLCDLLSPDAPNVYLDIKVEDPLNTNATEDESMAVEALRELGNTAVYTTTESKASFESSGLTCGTCEMEFRTTSDLREHTASCRQLRCHICGEMFDRRTDLNNHLVCHAVDRPHSCRMCGNLFIYKKDLLEHAASHGGANINKCQVCGVTFNRPSSLTNHMKIHNYQPGRAITGFLREHQVEVDDDEGGAEEQATPTEVKEEPVDEKPQLQTPNLDMSKPHTCIYCHKTFVREKALISHLNLHSALFDNISQCDRCDSTFADELALSEHVCSSGIPGKPREADYERNRAAGRVCSECDKSFPTKQKLQRHMWIHRKKVFTCEICSFTFNAQEFLDSHRLAKHQGTAAYHCNECGKNFSSRQGLWEHGRVHGPTPRFKCEICENTFSSRQGYLIHKRRHTGERPYGCRFCWKSFRDGGTLRKHELIHTGERPHVCPICSRAFNQKVVLREHVRWLHAANAEVGEDGVTMKCVLCEAKFTERDELCAHIVKHSDQRATIAKDASRSNIRAKVCMVEVPVKVEMNSVAVGTEEGEGAFECGLCSAKFGDKSDLAVHVAVHI